MLRKRFQIGLIHVAVAMTLVPINSTLNRVMIKELALSATLVALLASLPYLFSPIQVAIGSFADRHPLGGLRRTPYILIGLLLCVLGVILSPYIAFRLAENFGQGLLLAVLAFGAWGMGFNIASVSYFSLASEISGENGRSRSIAVMFFMMIVGIIATSIGLSRLLDPYSPELLMRSFWVVGGIALVLGILGIIRLEERPGTSGTGIPAVEEDSWGAIYKTILQNPQAVIFFIYMILLLAAILGQDVLLEPFGGEAFGMSISATTRITSIWGVCMLAALVISGLLEGRVDKRAIARGSGTAAIIAFLVIALSGILVQKPLFYAGVVMLGASTGLSTVSNLSLMLDMTSPGKVGLYMGAWGMANAIARLVGSMLSGIVRDTVNLLANSPVSGYVVVFGLEAIMLLISLLLLRRVSVSAFKRRDEQLSLVERAAAAND